MATAQRSNADERHVPYKEIVSYLTDLERIALLPKSGEATILASSYDRGKRYDQVSDPYVNNDGHGFVREEGDKVVLADVKGAGALIRMWSATPRDGNVSIYLDDSPVPVSSGPFKSYFNHTWTSVSLPNLAYSAVSSRAPGSNNFVPIAFSKSCKIVADKNWGDYYQFTIIKFPPNTAVEATSLPLKEEDATALSSANAELTIPPKGSTGPKDEAKNTTVAPGQTAVVFDLKGPQAITGLRINLDLPKDVDLQRKFLSQLAIKITWDHDERPAVWAPLGDFFGSFGGAHPYVSFAMGTPVNGQFYSNWVMPFGERAKIEIINETDASVAVSSSISTGPLKKPLQDYGRFHAKWHRDAQMSTPADLTPDWPVLDVKGRGRLVGVHLHVWNPAGGWWGEGNEKFFVDGEKFPSLLGTGTEDFFGFAWSSAGTFSRPFHSQVLNENNSGHAVLNRWMIADSVPFQNSFTGYLEKYFSNARPTLYSAVAYWYQEAGGMDPYDPVPSSERVDYWQNTNAHKESSLGR